jgi:hypothetical protein
MMVKDKKANITATYSKGCQETSKDYLTIIIKVWDCKLQKAKGQTVYLICPLHQPRRKKVL